MAKAFSQRDGADLIIALFRAWTRARALGANPLPAMYDLADSRGAAGDLVPACDSCFALTEACLGRRLTAAPDLLNGLTPDEMALMLMLWHAPRPGALQASADIPHGLPGALCWASFAVMRSLGIGAGAVDEAVMPAPAKRHCPFEPPAVRAA